LDVCLDKGQPLVLIRLPVARWAWAVLVDRALGPCADLAESVLDLAQGAKPIDAAVGEALGAKEIRSWPRSADSPSTSGFCRYQQGGTIRLSRPNRSSNASTLNCGGATTVFREVGLDGAFSRSVNPCAEDFSLAGWALGVEQ